jgi:tripartite-type tricarboxylate transporter receptor subunit TctC
VPEPILRRLIEAGQRALRDPEVRARVLAQGIIPLGGGPAEFLAYQTVEKAKWGKVIRERGIRASP